MENSLSKTILVKYTVHFLHSNKKNTQSSSHRFGMYMHVVFFPLHSALFWNIMMIHHCTELTTKEIYIVLSLVLGHSKDPYDRHTAPGTMIKSYLTSQSFDIFFYKG